MSELALRNENNELALHTDTFSRLASWAEAAGAAHKVATNLVQTSFVPEAFRGKAMEATAAILAGAEVGLDPMASLRSFDIIQGTAAPRANTLRAVVQSKGHEIVLVESTQTRAKVRGRRRGESAWQESIWTIERATKLGLMNKSNWKNQPQAMLVARATAECARLIASDAILGIPYASEELADNDIVPDGLQPEVKSARKTAQRKPATPPAPAPEPDFETDTPAGPDELDDPISKPQMALLQKLLTDAGITDQQAKRDYCTQQLGRVIGSVTELSKHDAGRVIDALTPVEEPPGEPEPSFDEAGGN